LQRESSETLLEPRVDDDMVDARTVTLHPPFLEHRQLASGLVGGRRERSSGRSQSRDSGVASW